MQLLRFTLILSLALVACSSDLLAQPTAKFAPVKPAGDPATFGANIQRTMTLLATSTPEKRNRVRILFYGQSVTRNPWWEDVANDLRQRFPHADLEIENRAIGGYGGPVLINTAEFDLYPFYPDLVIFHVWSGVETGHQEKIIRRIRERTTAEVLLWTSNLRWPSTVPPDGDPQHPDVLAKDAQDQAISDLYFRLGRELNCEVADVRTGMQHYLKQHDLVVKDTLRDTVHPNKLGNFLIAELVKPHLRYDPSFPDDKWKDLVTEIPVNEPRVQHKDDGSLTLKFQGNRIDVIAAPSDAAAGDAAKADVLLDGKSPSQFPELYYHTRPSPTPVAGRPAFNRIDHRAPLQVETWTARILECDLEKDVLRYEVSGSKTGPDGTGDHKQRFVSNSGRVVIEPRMWMVNWSLRYRKQSLPQDYKVTWETRPLFVDVWQSPAVTDAAKEYPTVLAQGFKNGDHSLTLKPQTPGKLPVKAFRIYRPPLKVSAGE
ncbi:MAG: SGNH/GDSL hydrolase family protein [Gimesia chilikensis]|uniref:SGNH/GDSL hydrolase family protein n=1 Tax=Gimesia chilikensis TaxID=2605989 RepID=UPI00379B65A3